MFTKHSPSKQSNHTCIGRSTHPFNFISGRVQLIQEISIRFKDHSDIHQSSPRTHKFTRIRGAWQIRYNFSIKQSKPQCSLASLTLPVALLCVFYFSLIIQFEIRELYKFSVFSPGTTRTSGRSDVVTEDYTQHTRQEPY